jgi:aspartokinase
VELHLQIQETAFEKKRGVSKVEVSPGFAQVHISNMPDPIQDHRLLALQQLKECGIGLFFLKLTPTGISFLVHDKHVEQLQARFAPLFKSFSIRSGKSIVFVHAVNMRDEEGLMAGILSQAVASGARIEHLGDMHDALCIAATNDDAELIASAIRAKEFGAV